MPKVEITSATDSEEPVKYTPPHERESGPWEDHELDSAGHHLDMAEKIKGNPKMAEAIAKHHEKKAKHHQKMAASMKGHMKRGLVSVKQLEKVSKSNHG